MDIPLVPSTFTFLTDEIVQSWQAKGKASIVKTAVRLIGEQNFSEASAVFQELLKAVVSGRLLATEAGSTLRVILADMDDNSSLPTLLLDQFSENLDDEVKARSSLRKPLHDFLIASNVSPALVRELLSSETLGFLGFTRQHFQNMTVRHATNVLYRQSAFNLLREETEGYSKLMTEYFTAAETVGTSAAETWERVKALIGTFNMDPGRVLDVTLDVFSTVHVRRTWFCVKMLRASSWWPQPKQIEGVETEQTGFSGLPPWAEPDVDASGLTADERNAFVIFKEQRDIQFWTRVQEKGIEAFFELGGRRILGGEDKAQQALLKAKQAREEEEKVEDQDLAEAENDAKKKQLVRAKEEKDKEYQKTVEDLVWITTTHTFPAPGNRTAAQIFGFKLRFYASDVRAKADILPDNLISLAALLIKIGFISLNDLYPHLYPEDKDMSAHREKLEKDKEEREQKNRPGGGENALTLAAPLFDDGPDHLGPHLGRSQPAARSTPLRSDATTDKAATATAAAELKPAIPEPTDQKHKLVIHLLLIGAIPESLYILSRFPWLLDVYSDTEKEEDDIVKHVNRLLRHSVGKVYDDLNEITEMAELPGAKPLIAGTQPAAIDQVQPDIITKPSVQKKTRRHMYIEKKVVEGDNAFYWEDWADHVPVCQTVDDVFLLCGSLLRLVGIKIGKDSDLFVKLIRIGRASLKLDPSKPNMDRWWNLSRRVLFPALSMTTNNKPAAEELFELLKNFSLEARFSIYAECYTGPTSRLPDMKIASDRATAETKDVLKRMSKENRKQMGQALAKPIHSNPGVAFPVAIFNLEHYENVIDVFVDCGKFIGNLAFEVLNWSLLNALGKAGRDRLQPDGMLTSRWLKRVSVITGEMNAKYPMSKVNTILQYLALQLQEGNFADLEILVDIVKSMSGILSDCRYPEDLAIPLAGAPSLRQETLRCLSEKRHDCKKSAQRLMKALKETNLAATVLILVAQERQLYAYRDENSDAPLKVVDNNLEKIHAAFLQYLEFLRFTNSVESFDAIVPDLPSLITDFGIEPAAAFEISRPSLHSRIWEADKALLDQKGKQESRQATPNPKSFMANGDVPIADTPTDVMMEDAATNGHAEQPSSDAISSAAVPKTDGKSTEVAKQEDVIMEDTPQAVATPFAEPAGTSITEPHPALKELTEQVQSVLPEEMAKSLNMTFYIRFWSMTLYDLGVTAQYYQDARKSLDKWFKDEEPVKDDKAEVVKLKTAHQRYAMQQKDIIWAEYKRHIAENKVTLSTLVKEKSQWFIDSPRDWNDETLTAAIVDYCFLPRLIESVVDEKYVHKLFWQLHTWSTPGFRTSQVIDYIMREKKITNFLFQCTESEADNLGYFLNDLLKILMAWHHVKHREKYEQAAWGTKKEFLGFIKEFDEDPAKRTYIDHEDFRRLLYKWHCNLHNAFKPLLNSKDDTHIRNAIRCMTNMQTVFPEINFHGQQTMAALSKLAEEETREDIKRMAQMLKALVKRREKQWQMPQMFRTSLNAEQKEPEPSNENNSSQTDTSQPMQVDGGSSTLNATAPEFKPAAVQANGISSKAASEKGDVEDGEVEEGKSSQRLTDTNAPADNQIPSSQPPPEKKDEAANAPVERTKTPQPAAKEAQVPSRTGTPSAPQAPSRGRTPVASTLQSSSSLLPRPDPQAPTSHQPLGRQTHALPSRPDVGTPRDRDRFPPHSVDRGHNFPRHDLPRDARRGNAEGRLERPDDMPRYESRGRGRDRSPGHHSRQRTPERGPLVRYEAREGPRDGLNRDSRHPRETRSSANLRSDARPSEPLPPRDRYGTGPRSDGPNNQPPANANNLERPASAGQDRAPAANSEGAPSIQQGEGSSQSPINPDRAALIERENRPDAGRGDRDNQRAPRAHSPHRRDGPDAQRAEPPQEPRRDGRGPPSDRGQPPASGPARDRRTEANPGSNLPPPSGPRSLRPGPADASSRPREPLAPPRTPFDNGQSLHPEQEFAVPSRAQEAGSTPTSNAPDIPSGPRDGPRGRGRGRPSSRDFRFQEQHPPGPLPSPNTDRPPLFPRDTRRSTDAQGTQPPTMPQSPATASNPADTSGVHPSRLAQIQPTLQTNVPSAPPNAPSAPANQPPASAPSGPRAPRPSSGGHFPLPSPTGRNPPTGPMSATDRQDRRFTNLQNTLNQAGGAPPVANDRGTTIRGRASNARPSPPTTMPFSPATAPPIPTTPAGRTDPLPMRPEPSRRESLRSRDNIDERPDSRNSRRSEGGRDQRRDDRADTRPRDDRRGMPTSSEGNRDREQPRENDERGREDRAPRRSLRGRDDQPPRSDPRDRDRREPPRDSREGGRRDTRGLGPIRDDDHRNGGMMPPGPGYGRGPPMNAGPPPHGPPRGHMGWDSRGPPGPPNGEARTPRRDDRDGARGDMGPRSGGRKRPGDVESPVESKRPRRSGP